jgi:hypothetical protein
MGEVGGYQNIGAPALVLRTLSVECQAGWSKEIPEAVIQKVLQDRIQPGLRISVFPQRFVSLLNARLASLEFRLS